MASQVNYTKYLKNKPFTNAKNRREEYTSQLILWSQYYWHQTHEDITQKRKLWANIIPLMNTDAKILNKILANQTPQDVKRIHYHDKVNLLQKHRVGATYEIMYYIPH